MRRSQLIALLIFGAMAMPLLLPTPPGSCRGVAVASQGSSVSRGANFIVDRATHLHERAQESSRVIAKLHPKTVVLVVGTSGDWFRVRSTRPGRPDGYIRRSSARVHEVLSQAPRFRPGLFRLSRAASVHTQPKRTARRIATLRTGTEVQAVAREGAWYRIESASGQRPPGYIEESAARRVRDL